MNCQDAEFAHGDVITMEAMWYSWQPVPWASSLGRCFSSSGVQCILGVVIVRVAYKFFLQLPLAVLITAIGVSAICFQNPALLIFVDTLNPFSLL